MEDRSASPASASQPHGSLQSSITARGGAAVNAPQLVNCNFKESVNITCNHTHVTQHESHTPQTTAPDIILRVSEKLKSNLRKKFEPIFEGIAKRGNPALFRDIYTELYITVGETEGVNKEHEVWQLDPAFKTPHEQDTPIDCNEIFNPLKQQSLIRTVMTKGVAGIGKTVSVQKFILDWAEKKANQDIELLFVLPFRELNRIINEECSLHELLRDFHSELQEFDDVKYYDNCKTLFIFDGLDESKLPFHFEKKRVSNVSKSASLDELITNIIEGNLLPSALVWITSRPAAIDNIPAHLIHRMTEIRGFTDLQKDVYFRKRISDENLANRIISHVKEVRTLQIMCHIPVFCWIIATVLKNMLKEVKSERIPSSLTEMYTRFLLIQTNEKKKKYLIKTERDPSRLSDADVQIILKLGKLAFENLMKRNIVFSEPDLRDYGIDVTEASVRSGVFTEIAREEDPMFSVKTYSFVHLSFQEYLAAFFVFYTFAVEGISLISDKHTRLYQHVTVYDKLWDHKEFGLILSNPVPAALAAAHDDDDDDNEYNNDSHFKQMVTQEHLTLYELQKNAIHSAIKSRSGHLDLFLRFLLGLSMESNFFNSFNLKVKQEDIDQTRQYIKNLFREKYESKTPSSERCINLFHCLLELNDHSMAEEIQRFLSTEKQTDSRLTAAQCSTLAYIILMSKKVLGELDLNKYNTSEEGRRRLVPAVRNCRKALMADCRLTEHCYKALAAALQDRNSPLRELDLSHNSDLPLFLYCLEPGLNSPYCRLENLNISYIDMYISGASILHAVLMGPQPQPHTLKLCACYILDNSAETLFSAFQSSPCQLKELDISYNSLTLEGVEQVLKGLQSPSCCLEVLRLSGSQISAESCTYLAKALERSFLRELILDNCSIGDVGVKHLCPGLMSPHCQLQTLGLSGCLISEEGCRCLASALSSNPSSVLRNLDLSYNHPGDEGEKLLSKLLNDTNCKLQTLRLDHCGQSRLTAGLWKYYQELNIGCITHHVICSQDRKGVAWNPCAKHSSDWEMPTSREQSKWGKACCREKLTDGRFYWEVQCTGSVTIALKEDKDRGQSLEVVLDNGKCYANHSEKTHVKIQSYTCRDSNTFGVYLDLPGSTVSFYWIYSWGMKHFYTFQTTFNEPVIPEFWVAKPTENEAMGSTVIVTQYPDSVQRTSADLTEQLKKNVR